MLYYKHTIMLWASLFFRILDCHQEMNQADSPQLKTRLLKKLKILERHRMAVTEKLHEIIIVPSYKKAARISGSHPKRFRYGLKLFCRKLKEYFYKDSYSKDKAA